MYLQCSYVNQKAGMSLSVLVCYVNRGGAAVEHGSQDSYVNRCAFCSSWIEMPKLCKPPGVDVCDCLLVIKPMGCAYMCSRM